MKRAIDGAELLAIAEHTLRGALLDELPPAARYLGLMVANSMAIAARESALSDDDYREQLQMFEGLYGADAVAASGSTTGERLDALNRQLARDIRSGVLDGACGLGVQALLLAQTTLELRVSNPRFLASRGIE